jgi:hypothetical protein
MTMKDLYDLLLRPVNKHQTRSDLRSLLALQETTMLHDKLLAGNQPAAVRCSVHDRNNKTLVLVALQLGTHIVVSVTTDQTRHVLAQSLSLCHHHPVRSTRRSIGGRLKTERGMLHVLTYVFSQELVLYSSARGLLLALY